MNLFIKAIIDEIADKSDFIIIAMQSDIDHIYLMIQYLLSITQIIHKIKQITTYKVWREKRFV